MPAFLALLIGVLVGLLSGGKLRTLASFRLRFEVPILLLFVLQAAARGRLLWMLTPTRVGLVVWMCSSAVLCVLLLANRGIPGVALTAIGLLLNIDVVLANGGMPVRAGSLSAAQLVAMLASIARSGGFYRLANGSTMSPWLGDVMPLTVFGSRLLVSVGDVALAVGVLSAVVFAMTSGIPTSSPGENFT